MIDASRNVFIGDHGRGGPRRNAFKGGFRLLDDRTGRPRANCRYRIVRGDGTVVEGTTDSLGYTDIVHSDTPEQLRIEVDVRG